MYIKHVTSLVALFIQEHDRMICGPNVARAVAKSEEPSVLQKEERVEFRYYEENPTFRKRSLDQVPNSTR